jgi:antitoxin FitA
MQNAVMPNVTIRNVPPEVHAVLSRRAAAAGQSLQQYLLAQLTEMSRKLSPSEWIEEVAQLHSTWPERPRPSNEEIVAAVRSGRTGR